MVQVNIALTALVVLIGVTSITRGQNTCDTCINDTEFTPCGTNDVMSCSIVGNNYICVPDAPRDTLCQSPPPSCTQEGKFIFQIPGECDRYYECDSSLTATSKFCPSGQYFSESKQECVPAEESECTVDTESSISNEIITTDQQISSSEQSSSSTNSPTTPLNTETNTFSTGNAGTQTILSSITTTDSVPETSPIITTVTPIVTTDRVSSISSESSSVSSTQNSTDITTIAPEECTRLGRLPDPNSCNRFYICVWRPFQGFMKVSRTCPFRLVYDINLRNCRFNTRCGNRPRSRINLVR